MSFFDDADEQPSRPPRTQPRREPRGEARRGRTSGGRPPSGPPQAIRTRRIAAAVVVVVLIILMAVGIHSCQASQAESALKDYNAQVNSLISASDETGKQLFGILDSASSHSPTVVYTQITNGSLKSAQSQLDQAQSMNVPGAVQAAHSDLVRALTMRRDGIQLIGYQIEKALGTTGRNDAVYQIAAANARFYASDVLYKSYSLPETVAQLNGAGIAVGGVNGVAVNGGQFLTDLGWLTPSTVGSRLGVPASGSGSGASGEHTPGLHGHSLNTVSVAGTTLQPGVTNYVAATPAPQFTLSITNGGNFNEYNVVCKVSVAGLSDTGTSTIPETIATQSTTCNVTLPTSPPAGTYNVTAEVEPVPLETNTANNSLTFPVTFTG